jgi:predicted ATPase
MLEEFTVGNYKTFVSGTFRPREMNLLVGKNNAGKSNLCQALRFVSASTHQTLDQCADTICGFRIGLTSWFYARPTIDFHLRATIPYEDERLTFTYDLSILAPSGPTFAPRLEVESEKLVVTGGPFQGVPLLENTRNGVRLLHETAFMKGETYYAETTVPRDTTMLQRLYELETNARMNRFKQYLKSWRYYHFEPSALRSISHVPNEVVLRPDGSNLASMVYQLKTGNERLYRKLFNHVREVDPQIEIINFTPVENNVFMFFDFGENRILPASSVSEGTLRYIALFMALLTSASALDNIPRPLVVIEEPENGLYVGLLRNVIESAEQQQNRPQLVFTSHSPYFIDLFDNYLDGIFMITNDKGTSSIKQPDLQVIQARLTDYPLGEQHFREMLG